MRENREHIDRERRLQRKKLVFTTKIASSMDVSLSKREEGKAEKERNTKVKRDAFTEIETRSHNGESFLHGTEHLQAKEREHGEDIYTERCVWFAGLFHSICCGDMCSSPVCYGDMCGSSVCFITFVALICVVRRFVS